jgi:hypothetical protein
MNQICTKCGNERDEQLFSFRNKQDGIRHGVCKLCVRLQNNAHYDGNKSTYKRRAIKNRKRYYVENVNRVVEYLSTHPCVDCPEADPVVLQFDHVRGKKFKAISRMLAGYSWEVICDEIKKCEVRCANCHLKRHAKESGWIKGRCGGTADAVDSKSTG